MSGNLSFTLLFDHNDCPILKYWHYFMLCRTSHKIYIIQTLTRYFSFYQKNYISISIMLIKKIKYTSVFMGQ